MMGAFKRLIVPAAIIACVLSPLFSQGMGSVLVLGFDSPQLNEVQDRLLRETVMKELIAKGYAVIPVMEVESLIQEEGINRFRKASRADMKDFCERVGASVAVNGKIAIARGYGAKSALKEGTQPYACIINVYEKKSDTYSTDTVFAESSKDLQLLINTLSGEIARAAHRLLAK